MRPDANAGEEVALREAFELVWLDICDRSFVNGSRRYVPSDYEVAQPLRGEVVDLVIVGGQ